MENRKDPRAELIELIEKLEADRLDAERRRSELEDKVANAEIAEIAEPSPDLPKPPKMPPSVVDDWKRQLQAAQEECDRLDKGKRTKQQELNNPNLGLPQSR